MALKVSQPTEASSSIGTPSSQRRSSEGSRPSSSQPSQPSTPSAGQSIFAPFFDDKKREMQAPAIPDWRVYKSGSKPLRRRKNFTPTGIPAVDDFFGGGIPKGLTVFVGEAGSGKSTLARRIALSMPNSLYVVAEKEGDDPECDTVTIMDYRQFLPTWYKALAEVLLVAEKINASCIVIDSSTRFFAGTNKAIEESDLRPALFEIARKTEGIIPVICISEVRGSGWNMYPAGGQAVAHAPVLLVWFNKFVCRSDNSADRFGRSIGEKVWTIEVAKDARNIAKSNAEYEVVYDKDGNLSLSEPDPMLRGLKGGKGNGSDRTNG